LQNVHFYSFVLFLIFFAGRVTWCTLAYWEERTRVGRLFQVRSTGVEVFSQLPRPSPLGDAMCLATLATNNLKPSESTLKTREKIGLGKFFLLFSLNKIFNFGHHFS
jgi:hypothetical protein